MYAPLSEDETASASTSRKHSTKTPIVPVPESAPEMKFKHPKHGLPTQFWPYKDGDGQLVGYVCRWDFTGEDSKPAKEILPVTFCDLGNGRTGWRSKGIPAPRPLFALPAILAHPESIVLVVEGEKTRDAARDLFREAVATTPAHGAKSPHLTDFVPLAGRIVIVLPDYDEPGRTDDRGRPLHPGRDFADKVTELAQGVGAAAVYRLAPEIFAAWRWVDGERVERGAPIPDGWDLADAIEEGWTAERVSALLKDMADRMPADTAPFVEMIESIGIEEMMRLGREARARVAGEETVAEEEAAADEEPEGYVWPFRLVWNGVEKRIERTDKDTGTVTVEWRWFCSRLEVGAETRSSEGEEWGRLLTVTDRDGKVKDWAMPMAMLAGDGTAYRERLLSLGLVMASGKFPRDALHEYISTARPEVKARCVGRIGWQGKVYVRFNRNFGAQPHA